MFLASFSARVLAIIRGMCGWRERVLECELECGRGHVAQMRGTWGASRRWDEESRGGVGRLVGAFVLYEPAGSCCWTAGRDIF